MTGQQHEGHDDPGRTGLYYSASHQPDQLAGQPPPPQYEVSQPFPQSAPPYAMPTTGVPYSHPTGYPEQVPYAAPPPHGADESHPQVPQPAPQRKTRQVVWFVSGIIAAMVIATLLVGGVVIGKSGGKDNAGDKPEPTAQASASASPSATPGKYNIAGHICSHAEMKALQKLAPNLKEAGESDTQTSEGNVVTVTCHGMLFTTGNDDGRASGGSWAEYHPDTKAAEQKYRELNEDCSPDHRVSGLGQAACLSWGHRTVAGDKGRPPASGTGITVWDGNMIMSMEFYHGGSLTDKMEEMRKAVVADAGALLKELAAE